MFYFVKLTVMPIMPHFVWNVYIKVRVRGCRMLNKARRNVRVENYVDILETD